MKRRDRLVQKYRKAMDWARTYLAADVVIINYYTGESSDCPDCTYDPMNNESTNINCPLCNGTGKIRTEINKTIYANVSWRGITEKYAWTNLPGGKVESGDVVISCKLVDVLTNTSNTASQTYFDICNYVMVNNRKCKVETTPLRYGLAGDLYNCAVVLVLDED